MITVDDYHARAVGVLWCRKEDYAAFLAICEDADRLPATWEKFAEFSQTAEDSWKAKGYIVERAYIDPETFPAWCAQRGLSIDSKARMTFAASLVSEKYGRNQS